MSAKGIIELAVLWLENFTSESKRPLKTYFQGIFFRKVANKLKATEQKICIRVPRKIIKVIY